MLDIDDATAPGVVDPADTIDFPRVRDDGGACAVFHNSYPEEADEQQLRVPLLQKGLTPIRASLVSRGQASFSAAATSSKNLGTDELWLLSNYQAHGFEGHAIVDSAHKLEFCGIARSEAPRFAIHSVLLVPPLLVNHLSFLHT